MDEESKEVKKRKLTDSTTNVEFDFNDDYSYSYMHKTQVTNTSVNEDIAPGIIITTSIDGVIKFWLADTDFKDKKATSLEDKLKSLENGNDKNESQVQDVNGNSNNNNDDDDEPFVPGKLIFIKQFKLFEELPIIQMAYSTINSNNKLMACISDYSNEEIIEETDGKDKKANTKKKYQVYIFDLSTIDMISIFEIDFKPGSIEWCETDSNPSDTTDITNTDANDIEDGDNLMLAVSSLTTNDIYIFDPLNDMKTPMYSSKSVHKSPVHSMKYIESLKCMISIDNNGMIEYWVVNNNFTKPVSKKLKFENKINTDLIILKKLKLKPMNLIQLINNKTNFVIITKNNEIFIFDIFTGKLINRINESLDFYKKIFQVEDSGNENIIKINKKFEIEKNLFEKSINLRLLKSIKLVEFDNFLIIPNLIGLKLLNLNNNKIEKLIKNDSRFLSISKLKIKLNNSNRNLNYLITSNFKSNRILIYTNNKQNENDLHTDIFNENPTNSIKFDEIKDSFDPFRNKSKYQNVKVILHTNYGDIKIKVFPRYAPVAVENFIGLCYKNYYNNLKFHRIIKNFMIQTGDPNNDGTGGESLWGKPFRLELRQDVKHDKPFMVSMAHGGSQFFITVKPTPWLDGKHSIFGRVYEGTEVVKSIENYDENDAEKPYPKILSTSIEQD
ncbi:unnamed protein product [[Candida] boidinii]|uniref:peptidylprolyl isomerase n=1 Tax=Candida boidinii TaxID=5477 RepID=A0A9W6SXF3_CANBO|nr:hypothetical protein B5S30_g4696 [[Candida] boidinii]OWB86599.1 hypothetical protein B5S33_g5304 [[Candida] boidinii]GME67959.1 unnamed protein product [[Candida] boidinii]GMF99851.1 unnamed protein product [[Candida] boidinii]